MYLLRSIKELRHVPVEELLEGRYQKFRRMGLFETKGAADGGAAGDNGLPGPSAGP
jgi:acetyl-CoA carboxylase alpha subunit